ncbi:MAG: hypothetical protein AAGB46_13500 [Verrucomicrobiota bacterium]
MRTPIKSTIALLATLSVLALGYAEPKQWQVKAFQNFDANSDKALDESEYIAQRLNTAKKNAKKNNKEFDEAKVAANAKRNFSKADKNGDGKLSGKEFYASMNQGGNKKKKKS